jgi:hypothetical protein
MHLGDLKVFATVVRQGGITRAPERLHRVQSNVTTRIPQLEDELGVPLFIREMVMASTRKGNAGRRPTRPCQRSHASSSDCRARVHLKLHVV